MIWSTILKYLPYGMDFSYQIENHDPFLKIESIGTVTHMGEYKKVVKNFYLEIKEHETNKLLIDMVNVLKPDTVLDQLEIANYLNNSINFPGLRKYMVAIIAHKEHFDSYKFFSLYAANIGLKMRIFLDEQDAEDWLIESQKMKSN